jgi:hypothetical protein
VGRHQLLPVLLLVAVPSATVLVPFIVGHLCKVKFEETARKEISDLAF